MDPPSLLSLLSTSNSAPLERLLPLQHQLAPLPTSPACRRPITAIISLLTPRVVVVPSNNLRQHPHPAVLVGRAVGIEIYQFPVIKPDPEPLLDKHVPFLILGKRGPA